MVALFRGNYEVEYKRDDCDQNPQTSDNPGEADVADAIVRGQRQKASKAC
jgi:hypothetical protein